MDYKLNGLLSQCVFLLMVLEIQWRPVFPAPTPTSCVDDKTISLTKLLECETSWLLGEYIKFHGPFKASVPDEVPDSTVAGVSASEKLQNIYIKNKLFHFHISKVEEYQEKDLGNPQSVRQPLTAVKVRLSHLLYKIEVLMGSDPEILLPTTPALPQLSQTHDFAKKVYGWGVIVRLKDWLTQVSQVLEKVEKEVCERQRGKS
uniref:uncharacterized protein LOC124057809 n=1 Tax=Scatophagus argus TaxID=75038 RepID=UPI001ED83DDC|nr:uncharacterized protein LOC124057809 [Scatophagus argus]